MFFPKKYGDPVKPFLHYLRATDVSVSDGVDAAVRQAILSLSVL